MSDVQSTLDVYGVLLGGKYATNMKGPDFYDEDGNFVKDGKQNEDLISGFIGLPRRATRRDRFLRAL